MISKKLLAWLMGLASAVALAQPYKNVIETANTRVEVLGQGYQRSGAVSPQQSRVVIYNPEGLRLPGATSVFFDGRYHASLIPGAYSELCYAPGSTEIGARQMEVGSRPKDPPDTVTAIRLVGGQSHYLRVREQGGRPVLEPVTAAQAEQELAGKRMQQHTVSRVAQQCVASAAPQIASVEAARHTLAADTLFAFAKSDRSGMTALGLSAIDNLVQRLRNDYSRIERLHIIGHADPLGSPAINDRLSIERANTVRQHIETTGQLNVPISAEGRGAREPVVIECSRVDTPQARACNQPNRRVVIEVTGQRR